MEHRRDVRPGVGGGEAEFEDRRAGVGADVAMGQHDALRRAGGAARVVELCGFVGVGERQRCPVGAPFGHRARHQQRATRQRPGEHVRPFGVRGVVQQQLGVRVLEDALLLADRQPRVQRHQDRTGGGGGEVGEQVVELVVHQAADAIAGLHAALVQRVRQLSRQPFGGRVVDLAGALTQGFARRPAMRRLGEEVEDVHGYRCSGERAHCRRRRWVGVVAGPGSCPESTRFRPTPTRSCNPSRRSGPRAAARCRAPRRRTCRRRRRPVCRCGGTRRGTVRRRSRPARRW